MFCWLESCLARSLQAHSLRQQLGYDRSWEYKGTGKRGHIVAETLLLMTFPFAGKLGNICWGHKMFLNKIRNTFCVPDTKFVSATNVARAGKRGNICVGNNVSATMCPQPCVLVFQYLKDAPAMNCRHWIQEMSPFKSEISRLEKTYVRFQIKNSSLNAVDLERGKLDSLI